MTMGRAPSASPAVIGSRRAQPKRAGRMSTRPVDLQMPYHESVDCHFSARTYALRWLSSSRTVPLAPPFVDSTQNRFLQWAGLSCHSAAHDHRRNECLMHLEETEMAATTRYEIARLISVIVHPIAFPLLAL